MFPITVRNLLKEFSAAIILQPYCPSALLFYFLVVVGFFMDEPAFQLPAAASIFLFFSILLAVSGAFSYFLESWSIPFLVLLFFRPEYFVSI